MIEVGEAIIQELPNLCVVINTKDVKGAVLFDLWRGTPHGFRRFFLNGENKPDTGAAAGSAVNLNKAVVPLHHSIDHRQTESGATALGLGGKEWFQTTLPGFLIHADAVVLHFDVKQPFSGSTLLRNRTTDGTGDKGDGATLRHGVHRIEDQVDQRFPEFTGIAVQQGWLRFQFALDVNGDP